MKSGNYRGKRGVPWQFRGVFHTESHGVPMEFSRFRPSVIAMENVFNGDTIGFYVKYSMEFPRKTFSIVILLG